MPMKRQVEIPPGLSPEVTERLLNDFFGELYNVKRMRMLKQLGSQVKWLVRVSSSPSDAVLVSYVQRKSFLGKVKGDPVLVVTKVSPGLLGPLYRFFLDDSLLNVVTDYLRWGFPGQVRAATQSGVGEESGNSEGEWEDTENLPRPQPRRSEEE